MKNEINENEALSQTSVSGCTGHFLTEAVNALVYKHLKKSLITLRNTNTIYQI